MKTPASLLDRLRQPAEQEAWSRFVDLYTPLLFFWACRLGCQEADAADLVQEVLTLLVRKLPEFRYDEHGSFRSWLRAVTHNKWREQRRRREVPRETAGGELDEVAVTDGAEAFTEAEYHQFLAARALRLMQTEFQPATWRACWEMVVCDRPAADVAVEVGLTVGAVYAAKARVLRRLRRELEGLLE